MTSEPNFADRLIAATRIHGPLCVGFDPYPELMAPIFGPPGPAAITAFGRALIAACAGRVAAVKPQISLFERFGAPGMAALTEFCAAARVHGLLVTLDAKRGDIGATASAYAAAYLGPDPVLHADCVTVNPLMGLDSLEPFFTAAERTGKGVAVLVRTSNPGGADFLEAPTPDGPLWKRIARALAPACERLRGAGEYSSLMVVMGATYPAESRALREILPRALILAPGYGAQGASAADSLAGFVSGPGGPTGQGGLEGGLVNASRAILYPPGAARARSLSEWSECVVAAIEAAKVELQAAAAIR